MNTPDELGDGKFVKKYESMFSLLVVSATALAVASEVLASETCSNDEIKTISELDRDIYSLNSSNLSRREKDSRIKELQVAALQDISDECSECLSRVFKRGGRFWIYF